MYINSEEHPEIKREDKKPFWKQDSAGGDRAVRQRWQKQFKLTFTGAFCDTCLPL